MCPARLRRDSQAGPIDAECIMQETGQTRGTAYLFQLFCVLDSAFFIRPRVALKEPCGSLVGALGTHYRRIGVALGWLCGRFRVAISWLSTGLGVALISY